MGSFPLFTGQGSESKIGFAGLAWTQLCYMRPELAGTSRVTALLRHRIQPRGGELGVLREGPNNERQIGIDDRNPSGALGLGHACLRQHPIHRRVMDAELGGNGIRTPALYKVIAKNLRFEIFTYRQCSSPSIKGCCDSDLRGLPRCGGRRKSRLRNGSHSRWQKWQ